MLRRHERVARRYERLREWAGLEFLLRARREELVSKRGRSRRDLRA